MDVSGYDVLATIAIAFLALMLVLALFEPGLPYKINSTQSLPRINNRTHRGLMIVDGLWGVGGGAPCSNARRNG